MMNKINTLLGFAFIFMMIACGTERERFNYKLIKSRLDLTQKQISQFDEITKSYTKRAREAYESNRGDRKAAKQAVEAVFSEQDARIKAILTDAQFVIYTAEIKIEREGREKYNMTLIREELALDSAQSARYDLANEAFYTLLIENHDNYHGKPDVYVQYYAEIDVSRQEAFRRLMTADQYRKYLQLAKEYELGESEAY